MVQNFQEIAKIIDNLRKAFQAAKKYSKNQSRRTFGRKFRRKSQSGFRSLAA